MPNENSIEGLEAELVEAKRHASTMAQVWTELVMSTDLKRYGIAKRNHNAANERVAKLEKQIADLKSTG